LTELTKLLNQIAQGDQQACELAISRIYPELKKIASGYLKNERQNTNLQPTSLVHEAYLKLININQINWQDRVHFYATAAKVMREILIDAARKRMALKRFGGIKITLAGIATDHSNQNTDILMLNDALEKLAKADPDRARLVELKFFGGLTIEEMADVMQQSTATIKRQWTVARAWLFNTLQDEKNTNQKGNNNDG